jgi:hypothetical protein
MQNTPTGRGSHLPTILTTSENHPKSRSVNNSFKCSDLDPHSRKDAFWQPDRRLALFPIGYDLILIGHPFSICDMSLPRKCFC